MFCNVILSIPDWTITTYDLTCSRPSYTNRNVFSRNFDSSFAIATRGDLVVLQLKFRSTPGHLDSMLYSCIGTEGQYAEHYLYER
jgi:hypothetical protein